MIQHIQFAAGVALVGAALMSFGVLVFYLGARHGRSTARMAWNLANQNDPLEDTTAPALTDEDLQEETI